MTDLSVAIITGGAQGLGAAIANALLKNGYKVCIADINEQTGQKLVAELAKCFGQEKIFFAVCDVTKESDYKKLFYLTLEKFKRIDVLINNAGIIAEKNPRKVLDVNVMGPIIGCQTALEYMGKSKGGKGGIVINTASLAGFLPLPSIPVYVASKHAVVGLTRSYGLTYHLKRDGVIFMALCPSYINTDLLHVFNHESLIEGTDVTNRPDTMSPDYVAQGVLKLLKDKINGSTLVVTNEGYNYVGFPEELKHASLE
ncbi:15-hydroxyprostaglandin dehydrogenase [NAD(+)]-like [Stegodyphus dumicola]|uniref:15-hydroxyprostaglandin dehydrogenase [NAD(+)]-like n=1 Tax=Stegodyphus dumicola TaxID=202533 RepID=UPI0015B2B4D5|nr:15-hydroxyprostaglandin dehydrogenase [NAD(+)]-like [Stegodyphus dumicola]